MATATERNASTETQAQPALREISVSGYKSLREKQTVEIRPFTILAGANSSGKSSLIQPLLLLKQTLESSFDPGGLLLNGPHVKCTSTEQILSKISSAKTVGGFSLSLGLSEGEWCGVEYRKGEQRGLTLHEMTIGGLDSPVLVRPDMSGADLKAIQQQLVSKEMKSHWGDCPWDVSIVQRRCFLDVHFKPYVDSEFGYPLRLSRTVDAVESGLENMIHVPGLRGNPERSYPITAPGTRFPGTFEKYTASIIARWESTKNEKATQLCEDLQRLRLTSRVTAQYVNDAEVELQVGRLPAPSNSHTRDLVNIADVGSGVSQNLPVLVALHVAEPGQTVYVEQPEIHLHPRAQNLLPEVMAEAAARGAQIIVETHSSLFLLGVQTLIAENRISPDVVQLLWFQRRKDGSTEIIPAELDEMGRFGDWPEDFADVSLNAQHRYLTAAEAKMGS